MMKTYTDIEQSKKLAEILPIESADMYYLYDEKMEMYDDYPRLITDTDELWDDDTPCWSLAALLSVLPNPTLTQYSEDKWNIAVFDKKDNNFKDECFADEPVDACYEMILKLHESKKK